MDLSHRAQLLVEERAAPGLELRQNERGELTFSGVASTVDQPYTVYDMFGEFQETMRDGAFNKTIKNGDVRLLINHDGVPLARTKSKTLTLAADPHLRAEASLDPSNPDVQSISSAMNRGDLDQMSIGFRAVRQEWNDDYTERTINEIQLFDVSVVTFPANPHTSASLRSLLYAELEGEEQIRAAIAKLQAMLPPVEPEQLETELVELAEESEFDVDVIDRMLALWDRRAVDHLARV